MKSFTFKRSNPIRLCFTTAYGGFLIQISRFAISFERNHPIYGKRFGIRVLRPFSAHGAGLHLGPTLIHFHTNRAPLYVQP